MQNALPAVAGVHKPALGVRKGERVGRSVRTLLLPEPQVFRQLFRPTAAPKDSGEPRKLHPQPPRRSREVLSYPIERCWDIAQPRPKEHLGAGNKAPANSETAGATPSPQGGLCSRIGQPVGLKFSTELIRLVLPSHSAASAPIQQGRELALTDSASQSR